MLPHQKKLESLKRLSRDQVSVNIPDLNTQDEIGQLAKAANIFNKNPQTHELLADSQSMKCQQEALKSSLSPVLI